jgi:hypothetical protein
MIVRQAAMRVMIVSDEAAERLMADDPAAVEVPVLAQMEDLVTKLMPPRPPIPDAGLLEQARRNAELRQRLLDEMGMLDAAQVAELSGSKSTNQRARASRWTSEGRIFGLPVNGRSLYPAFQFDEVGQPRPVVKEVLALLMPLNLSAWATAIWWDTGSDILDWRTPAAVLVLDPDAVVKAARLDARTLGH